jgi:excisionase family DNA binding protein
MKEKFIMHGTFAELADLIDASVKHNLETFATKQAKETKQKETVDFMTRKQVSETFQVSLATIHNWIKKGMLQPYKVGTRTRFKKFEVLAILMTKK